MNNRATAILPAAGFGARGFGLWHSQAGAAVFHPAPGFLRWARVRSLHSPWPLTLTLAALILLLSFADRHREQREEHMPTSSLPRIIVQTPLVDLDTVQAALGFDTKRALRMIEIGELVWAWNLATEIYSRREVRVLAQCLADFQNGKTTPNDWAFVVKTIFPMVAEVRPGVISTIPAKIIARQWCVKSDHAIHLMDAGWLRQVGSTRQRGRHGSPMVAAQSAVDFLKKRRMR